MEREALENSKSKAVNTIPLHVFDHLLIVGNYGQTHASIGVHE